MKSEVIYFNAGPWVQMENASYGTFKVNIEIQIGYSEMYFFNKVIHSAWRWWCICGRKLVLDIASLGVWLDGSGCLLGCEFPTKLNLSQVL